jgi:hypothetical protein
MTRQHSAAVQLGSTRRLTPLAPGTPWYKRLWRGWVIVSRWIGDIISRAVTTLMFLIALPAFAIGVRLFADPLELKPKAPHWVPLTPGPGGLDEAKRGF